MREDEKNLIESIADQLNISDDHKKEELNDIWVNVLSPHSSKLFNIGDFSNLKERI